MAISKKVTKVLKEVGAKLHSRGKREVWRMPNGDLITISVTKSDERAEKNQLADIKRALRK